MILKEKPAQTRVQTGEIAPPSHQRWVKEGHDGFAGLEERFRRWGGRIEENEELFQQNVYKSENASDGDFRQHRARLCALMAEGESMAYDFLVLLENQARDEGKTYVNLIDQKLAALRATFFKWHGPLEMQSDIPESFKQAAREAKAGQIEDLEDL